MSRGPTAGHSGFAAGIRPGLVPQRFGHRRPRLLQKKPPPPNKSTSTTMIRSVSVDIHTDRRPGSDFAKWGVHPTSRLEQRTPNRITGDDLGRHHMTAPVRLALNRSNPGATGIPAGETPPCGRRRFFNDVGGQGFTPFAQGRLQATMNCHSNKVMPVLMDPVVKVLMRQIRV